jgi:hypothetical protein
MVNEEESSGEENIEEGIKNKVETSIQSKNIVPPPILSSEIEQ